MSLRVLALAAALSLGSLATATAIGPGLAQAQSAAMTMDELMHATALDDIFTQFGPGIASAPDEQGMPMVGAQKAAWEQSAAEVFGADRMHADLARALSDKFDPEDIAIFDGFFRSSFGEMVSEIERSVTLLPPVEQEAARQTGIALAAAADPRRNAQIDEMLKLVSAEIATAIVRQSVRGMLIGMSMTGQSGDIEVPWEEIDAHLDTIMAGVEADVQLTQRAMMFFAYSDLSEAELDQYLEFLRTTAAQKLYAIAAYSIGEIITSRMEEFGETLARRLAQVSV
jgi:hypothetical protein